MLEIPKPVKLGVSKSETNINTTISDTPVRPLNGKMTFSTLRSEELADQYLFQTITRVQDCNEGMISTFLSLDQQGRQKLEKYCISQFEKLPLFQLYEIAEQLGFDELGDVCTEELKNLNFEQLNYCKFDLMRCSFPTFRKILEEYNCSIKSLDIEGLRPSDLKSIITDYCLARSIEGKQKQNLYRQYIQNGNQVMNQCKAIRRSMIEPSSKPIQFPEQKPVNIYSVVQNPAQLLNAKNGSFKFERKPIVKEGQVAESAKANVQLIKSRVKEQHTMQLELCKAIASTKEEVNRINDREAKDEFMKLQSKMETMAKILKIQEQKIQIMEKSVSDMKSGTLGCK